MMFITCLPTIINTVPNPYYSMKADTKVPKAGPMGVSTYPDRRSKFNICRDFISVEVGRRQFSESITELFGKMLHIPQADRVGY